MLCPEVWKIKSPDHSISYHYGDFDGKKEVVVDNLINKHAYNKMISVVIPDTAVNPEEIVNAVADTDFYVIKDVQLSEFVTRPFIEGFIKRGELYALSLDTRIDSDDCVAITPCGKLHLSLNKETYQCLGLDGKLSYFSRKHQDRYVIQIDLKDPALQPGKSLHTRIKNALSGDVLPKFNISFAWTPPDATICPSSLAKYFSDSGHKIELVETKFKWHQEYSLRIPIVETNSEPHELVEYIGMLSLSCNLDADKYLNSYQQLEETVEIGSARILQWKGMFTGKQIRNVLSELRTYVEARPNLPWISIYINGFPHSPLSFGLKEHSFYSSGDNSYLIVLKPDKKYLFHQVLSSNKQPRT